MTKCQKCYTVVQITLKIFLLNVYHHLIKLITPWLSSFFFFFFSVLPSSGRSLAPTLSTTLYPQPSSSILHTYFSFFFFLSHSLLPLLLHSHFPFLAHSLLFFLLPLVLPHPLDHFSFPYFLYHLSLPLFHLSFLLLVCLFVSFPQFFLPTHPSIISPLSTHVLSNSTFSLLLFRSDTSFPSLLSTPLHCLF